MHFRESIRAPFFIEYDVRNFVNGKMEFMLNDFLVRAYLETFMCLNKNSYKYK